LPPHSLLPYTRPCGTGLQIPRCRPAGLRQGPRHELSALTKIILRNDPQKKLFDFLRQKLKDDLHKQSLDRFGKGDSWAVINYASALRHIYVHGHLTASPQGCAPENIAMICNEVSRSLLHWISGDFDRRLSLAAMV